MKTALLVDGDKKSIVLTPETKGERHILALANDHKFTSAYPTPIGEGQGVNALVLVLSEK